MAIATMAAEKQLDLAALRGTPGFVIRLIQLKFFDGFYDTFAELGLTPATYAILMLVRDNPGIVPSSVATLLRLHLPNLTKILHQLEHAGLVKRSRSKIDRRATEITLTSKGEKLMRDAVRLTAPYNRRMLAPLSEAERSTLIELLNRVSPF
ncbi:MULTISPECIES: MarR family winged helix-turn-helix transcriptional regulator [Bradyrhizobium]|uniref:MarR family transcriptional regulator n=1 Tax=Bradyrhizobium neotropicale TaxID=1497615 RepID=A0A176Z906_9BRAD|nr:MULTISPECIES: MarR family transcriptional regulator [Bradyrhizobium]OAF16312.1 MarR family transcriptional regulator [Bradyrhizobium neotropicale]